MSDPPVHLGNLERSGSVKTEDGWKLEIETDQGDFLLSSDSKQAIDALSLAVDMHLSKIMHRSSDDE